MKKLVYICSFVLTLLFCGSIAHAEGIKGYVLVPEDVFTEQGMTVKGGSGWSDEDKAAFNTKLTSFENLIIAKLNTLETKVNTSLQNVGAGLIHTYRKAYVKQGCGGTDGSSSGTIIDTIVCPIGKRPHVVNVDCRSLGYNGGMCIHYSNCQQIVNPPCI